MGRIFPGNNYGDRRVPQDLSIESEDLLTPHAMLKIVFQKGRTKGQSDIPKIAKCLFDTAHPTVSVLPNMAEPLRNETHQEFESFDRFFECWLVEQNQYLEELVSASKEIEQRREDENGRLMTIQEGLDERFIRPLTERVVKHYEHYYRAKSTWAKYHILSMFSPSWRKQS
ncbi:DOG1 domain-containing protein [Forsythia ovata]|uniref:DOG1 domain-containing protein n=1 Tax=Forsythia ovata TaxID=205694 RepID=A0ABD1U8B6_9LAMI